MLLFQQHLSMEVFSPHKVCWLNRYDIIFSHAVGDALTAIAYYMIPMLLIYATRKYEFDWTLKMVFYVYATFILLCGTTHLLDVIMIWKINEGIIVFDGWLRVATGVFSLFSAGVTVWALQMFLRLTARLIRISDKLRIERRDKGRATDETFAEYNEVLAQVKAYFHKKETQTDAA